MDKLDTNFNEFNSRLLYIEHKIKTNESEHDLLKAGIPIVDTLNESGLIVNVNIPSKFS